MPARSRFTGAAPAKRPPNPECEICYGSGTDPHVGGVCAFCWTPRTPEPERVVHRPTRPDSPVVPAPATTDPTDDELAAWARTYDGWDGAKDIGQKYLHYGRFTPRQRSVLLKIYREQHGVGPVRTPPAPRVEEHECFKCGEVFPSMDAVLEHKRLVHVRGSAETYRPPEPPMGGSGCTVCTPTEKCVRHRAIRYGDPEYWDRRNGPQRGIDLNSIPVGYYSVPGDPDKELFRLSESTRGKKAGMKYWKGASVYKGTTAATYGRQHPSDDTARFHERDLPKLAKLMQVLADPLAASIQYGAITGTCGRCGRKLEDDDHVGPDGLTSVQRNVGPDCAQIWGMF